MDSDIARILIEERQIQAKVRDLGAEIATEYEGLTPVFIGVLNGAVLFIADLIRACPIPLNIDFMAVSSYDKGTHSSGIVRILKDLDRNIEGRHVLIIEDIIDTGLTLSYLLDNLRARHPASLRVCTLLDKRERRTVDLHIDYTGFRIPDEFVVGYGLDYNGQYRNLPYIGVLKPHLYS